MASLSAIRAGLETQMVTLTDLSAYGAIPERPNLPAAVVAPTRAEFDMAMGRGTDAYYFDVYVLCSRAVVEVGQDALDDYVTGNGSKSIRQLLFNNTLGLANTSCHVARMRDYGGSFAAATIDHVGAVLEVVVYTKGTE